MLRVHVAAVAHAAPCGPAHLGKLIDLRCLADLPTGDGYLDALAGPIRTAASAAACV